MEYLWIAALLPTVGVVAAAARRDLMFGVFASVLMSLPTWAVMTLSPHAGRLWPLLLAGHLAAAVHFLSLVVRPQLRSGWFRALISVPGLGFAAASMLALPWLILASVGVEPLGWFVPFALAAVGTAQTLYTRETTVDYTLDPTAPATSLRRDRRALRYRPETSSRPLTIVQITDPHLGPYMSVDRLRRICARAVARRPDLILVTGDLMTMESHSENAVAQALAPLAAYEGRVFACHGNHDLEARRVLEGAYARTGVRLLVDQATVVDTAVGPVELIGLDFVWRGRSEHARRICAEHPRRPGVARLALVHDPGVFVHLPDGAADLVLSGHTHGGQLGLVSLGLPTTFVSLVSKVPDHGPWAYGRNRLYVHRAQGVYGFPIRLGVPGEQSLMRVHLPARSQ